MDLAVPFNGSTSRFGLIYVGAAIFLMDRPFSVAYGDLGTDRQAYAGGEGVDRPCAWWRRLLASLAPASSDIGERLARHYAAEIRIARGLARGAESLDRYPHQRVRILDAVECARGRAHRVRLALQELGLPVVEPAASRGRSEAPAFELLRASASELSSIGEAYLADAHGAEREHPRMAGLLYELHRETARDLRALMWTLAQVAGSVGATSLEEVGA